MRSLGAMILLSVTATAAAPNAAAPPPAPIATGKSVQAFAQCFRRSQDRQAAAWAFVAGSRGGTFSNLGAAGVDQPYFVVISDRGNRREIHVENVPAGSAAARGVSLCA